MANSTKVASSAFCLMSIQALREMQLVFAKYNQWCNFRSEGKGDDDKEVATPEAEEDEEDNKIEEDEDKENHKVEGDEKDKDEVNGEVEGGEKDKDKDSDEGHDMKQDKEGDEARDLNAPASVTELPP
eukprot:m51a1_g11455 hypothetical protein (128) ;mRNA; f:1076-2277